MAKFENSVIPIIESNSDNFTNIEKRIASFFINNREELDFSAKSISNQLYVSEAALSRFSKKIGFPGYREFIFQYKKTLNKETKVVESYIKEALNTYEELLNKSYALIDSKQIKRIVHLFNQKRRVFVYGMGSSGLAANEMKMRFTRLGIDVEAITDPHMLAVNSVRLNENCMVIGISISRATKEVISALDMAKERGAATILITSKKHDAEKEFYDEVVLVSVKKNLDYGNIISPQFPVLIMTDILYASYIRENKKRSEETYDSTLHVILDRNQ
ncbi:MurR/RpiR family transcriptional regulator [Faecalicatena contorta]|uniref:DNA-binding transcriptional regulator, MurR/RpiR family, contains HTH and SIS domains n=1 Tax=Faecalicatena contorta TaxID=39482 RepID=A0A315ZTW0_9FIRM|nr:MurR/RpiR family transcriptional regulator [Faecalicatena contorta]PWJ48613.1 RpiR family transcriptional regulator [Faecalicatena contorta]SUQ15349.1 DNA-binding transcriptional regulator, MurR/RpiR family, contains HTH and SIS domains [Faecalicatena contorta]